MFIVIDNNEGRMVKSICICDGEEENHINCLSVFRHAVYVFLFSFCESLRLFEWQSRNFRRKGNVGCLVMKAFYMARNLKAQR